ncbi:hypothetical protein ATANTOWER_022133 [Ataeniobius toweri]|uniref:Uncharacterized protein n=1 Tax=Ataeniobius toweri TaxID=208326 RepID=A0ABU7BAQ9_9TELE|nr:hypothetical protein [Ataeniobius toweri]
MEAEVQSEEQGDQNGVQCEKAENISASPFCPESVKMDRQEESVMTLTCNEATENRQGGDIAGPSIVAGEMEVVSLQNLSQEKQLFSQKPQGKLVREHSLVSDLDSDPGLDLSLILRNRKKVSQKKSDRMKKK